MKNGSLRVMDLATGAAVPYTYAGPEIHGLAYDAVGDRLLVLTPTPAYDGNMLVYELAL